MTTLVLSLLLAAPMGLQDETLAARLHEGRLRLSLRDVVSLLLANDTDVQISQLRHQQVEHSIERAHQAFEPVFATTFSSTRSSAPSLLDPLRAVPSDLDQHGRFGLSQTLGFGTRYEMAFSAGRLRTDSLDAILNPTFSSNLTLSLTQPLLRNFGSFPNRAPIAIAERGVRQSAASLRADLADAVSTGVNQYWDVVQARESLVVLQKSLELAEATYRQNKRALELGALPPLDIFRSEQQVASRRLQVIQAEYGLKRLEDQLRRTIGADLDPALSDLPLELTEEAATGEELAAVEEKPILDRALLRRSELEAAREQLAVDDIEVRLARNQVRPDLSLTGSFAYDGRSGQQLDPAVDPPGVLASGGLGDALQQLRNRDFPTYGLSLQLRLPLHNRAAEADLAIAQVGRRQGELGLRRQVQQVTLEVRGAVQELERAKASISAARLARDLGQKNLEAEQRKYELGVQTIFFVLDAQTQMAQAEVSLLQAYIAYRRAIVALDRATGDLLTRYDAQAAATP